MSSLLFVGGVLWSPADWPGPRAVQLLVTDGRIAAIGEHLDVPGVDRLDLNGGTLLPAFGDGHAHPMQAGLERRFAPVRGDTLAAVMDGVRRWAIAHPDADWIYGGGFDLSLSQNGVFEAAWLDELIPDRPVVLRGADYHTLWCNGEALRRSGITAQTPDPVDGEIVRGIDGTPVGTLREWGATSPVFAVMPPPDRAICLEAVRTATTICAVAGLTWVQDAWVEPDEAFTYLAATQAGALTVAVNMALRADPAHWRAQVAEFTAVRAEVESAAHPTPAHPTPAQPTAEDQTAAPPVLTARTVKFFVDGVIESGTAWMLEPYLDRPHSRGLANWAPRELTAAVAAFSGAGFQIHLHAIGDAAVRDALDALEACGPIIRAGDLRPVIAHLQVIHPADLGRLAELGVIACFQPLWAQPDPAQEVLTVPRIGSRRAARQYPIRSIVDRGTVVSFGSDWPVTDLSPLEGLVTAMTRQTPAGLPPDGWYPGERLDLRSALTAYTRGVAVQGFRDDAGLLGVGQVADLVWLDADLTRAGPADLRAAAVLGTWRSGVRIH